MDKFYITGTRRGLGEALAQRFDCVDTLENCDVFVNCKHNGFSQVELLYRACELGKRVISIGSNSPDQPKRKPHPYAVEKAALDKANEQLFYQGHNVTVIRFGYFDSPRVAHHDVNKMSMDYCVGIVEWVLAQQHRVKELTIVPSD